MMAMSPRARPRARTGPHSRRWRGTLLVTLLPALATCAGTGAPDAARGEWIGKLRTTAGSCPVAQDSDLDVTAGEVLFVPGDGVLTLRGLRDPADRDHVRAQLKGATIDRKTFVAVFDGRFDRAANAGAGGVSGTYGTPDCRAEVALHRPTHTALQRLLGD